MMSFSIGESYVRSINQCSGDAKSSYAGLHLQFTKAERLLTPHKAFMKAVVLESPLVRTLASIVAHVFEEVNLPMQTPSTLGISAAMGIRDSHGYL